MKSINRRSFLQRSLTVGAGSYLAAATAPHLLAQAGSAGNRVRVAVAGIRSQGNGHIGRFQGLDDVEVVALCDPDQDLLDQRVRELKDKVGAPGASSIRGYRDIRKVLERDDLDVVVIATPNHWHSLMTVWACQAGKHVYVEKPVSHSVWEGRKMVEAARKYRRVVQAGTQQRSCPAVQEAARDIQAGRYGPVRWAHCSKLASRKSIGRSSAPLEVPSNIDYELWAGPAPRTPVMRQQFHYDWHWQWNWGDGEMGNWGIHYIDDLRHILGWKDVPTEVVVAGNRFVWDDDGQTPNMHFALFRHEGLPVVVDIRNLPDPERGGDDGAVYLGTRGGNHIQCENGYLRIARGGGVAFDLDGKRLYNYRGDGGSAHTQNFIDAVRAGSPDGLNADIEVCHLSTVMCHQANIGFRVGAAAPVDQVRETMKKHPDALDTLNDMVVQLGDCRVDVTKTPFSLGVPLSYSLQREEFVGSGAASANPFLRLPYRDGFVVPEVV